MKLVSNIPLASGGSIGWGPSCDLCTPDVHLLVACGKCSHEWDEPPCSHDELACPKCFNAEAVTFEELQHWEREVLGLKD